MTTDDILYVFSLYDDWMTDKFFNGLELGDIYGFTDAQW